MKRLGLGRIGSWTGAVKTDTERRNRGTAVSMRDPAFMKPAFCSVVKDQLATVQTLESECFKHESYTGRM